jgi:hypothetical protein
MKKFFLFFFLLSLFFLMVLNEYYFVLSLYLFSFVIYFFYQLKKDIHVPFYVRKNEESFIVAPVSGIVKKIFYLENHDVPQAKQMAILFSVPLYLDGKLLIPITGSIIEFKKSKREGVTNFFYHYWELRQTLWKEMGEIVLLIKAWPFCLGNYVSLFSGDRAFMGAYFGQLIFGGEVTLLLPAMFDICVIEGEFVDAGKTLLAKGIV